MQRKAGMTDAQLRAVTIGERQSHDDTIHLAPYDPAWPAMFEQLAGGIREALGSRALQLEHVGSTSVPELAAKPIIDMVLVVSSSADEGSYVPPLEGLGYVLRIREPDWFEHRLLKAPEIPGNLHVFSAGCPEVRRMLAFRDWLRRDPNDRRFYQQTKQRLAAQRWKHVQNYADAKSEAVGEIMSRALDSQAAQRD